MTEMHQLPPVPQAQLLGDAAVLRGDVARDIYKAAMSGIRVAQQVDGSIDLSHRLRVGMAVLRAAATAASPDVRSDIADVRQEPIATESVLPRWVDVREAAGLLNVGVRQARRLVIDNGGVVFGRGYRIRLDLLQPEIDRRSA